MTGTRSRALVPVIGRPRSRGLLLDRSGLRVPPMADYLDGNRANWEERVPVHLESAFYDVEGWLRDRPGPPVWETGLLGPVDGLDVVQLQCHFGLDALSLADAGARVVGVDFSGAAIESAHDLAARAGLTARARFVEADVLHAAAALRGEQFDLVYVTLGSLCWLPSVTQWAEQVAALLRSGGRLFIHDDHPLSWAMAESELLVERPYFEEPEPQVDEVITTYTDGAALSGPSRTYEWNHSLGEIVTALLDHELRLEHLVEHPWTRWQRFPWLTRLDDARWVVPGDRPKVPLSFSILAIAP